MATHPVIPPETARPPRRRSRRWAVGLSATYLVVVIALWVWMLLEGDVSEWPTLLLFAPRWLAVVPLAPLALFAASARSGWASGLVFVTLGLVLGPVMGGRVNPTTWQEPQPAFSVVRVVTWNSSSNTPNEAFSQFVRLQQPDLILTQECPRDSVVPDLTRGWTSVDGVCGIRLQSRYPAKLVGTVGPDRLGLPGGVADFEVQTPDGVVRVCGIHLPSPRSGVEQALQTKFSVLSELSRVIAIRDAASATARGWVGDGSGPTLVVGDFNMPCESCVYRRDWGGFTDAFVAAGNGWGGTKFTRWHDVRIDHILTTPEFRVRRAVVGPESGSDHRPLFAELEQVVD